MKSACTHRFWLHFYRKRGMARLWLRATILSLALLLPLYAYAQAAVDPTLLKFQNRLEEIRFDALVSELRCVMCQNQSLADSNAMIAHDLRREILKLMREGKTDAQIEQFLVARYGEFVLYKPRLEGKTWLLWFGPVVLLLIGGLVITRLVRRQVDPHSSEASADVAAASVPVLDDTHEW